MKGEIFDETTAENVLAFSGKNRQQFVSYTNDGTEDDGNSSKPKYEQVTKQDAPGSEYVLWKKKYFAAKLVGSGVATLRMNNEH